MQDHRNRPSHPYHKHTEDMAKVLVETLVNNQSIGPQLLNIEVFSALFCKRNETFLEAMRWCFRNKLIELCDTLNNDNSSMIAKHQLLNRHICTLPLAGIKTGQEYLIPAYNKNDKAWQLVQYQVMPIELTPLYGVGRLALNDNNRLFAYGFTPVSQSNATFHTQALLVFISPEYPAQQGFLAFLYLWFQSVSGFYKSCEPNINRWLQDANNKNFKIDVHASGQAARLALESTFTTSAQYIENAYISDAYCLPYSISNSYKNRWQSQKKQPNISVQMRKEYYNLEEFIPGWHVYDANGNQLLGQISNEYCKIRIAINILSGIINVLLVMPCQYLLIPTIRAILNHKTELALLSVLVMVFVMLPGLVMTDIGTTLAVFTAVYFGCKLLEPLKVMLDAHEHAEAACHITNHTEERASDKFILENNNTRNVK